jgi:hypothetical protein
MKKTFISLGIMLVTYAGISFFTENPLAFAFFGTITGIFALMSSWAVKYYIDFGQISVRVPKGLPIPDEDEKRCVTVSFIYGKSGRKAED